MKRLVALAVILFLSISAFAQKTTFAGKVYDNSTLSPIKAYLQLSPMGQGRGITVKTDSNGAFVQKIQPGKYFLCAVSEGYIPYIYKNSNDSTVNNNVSQPTFVDPITGQAVSFEASKGFGDHGPSTNAFSVITFNAGDSLYFAIGLNKIVPPEYAILKGSIVDESSKLPLQGSVKLLSSTASGKSACIKVSKDGTFEAKVIAGQYILQASAKGYVSEFYDNTTDPTKATKLTINAKDTLKVSIGLAKYVPPTYYSVSGKVTDTAGNAVRASIKYFVMNNKAIPREHRGVATDKNGNYVISKVQENDTIVVFAEPSKGSSVLPEYYLDKKELSEATRIAVTANLTGIDFKLDPKPVYNNSISGKVSSTADEVLLAHVVLYNLNDKSPKGMKRSVFTDTVTGEYKFTNINPGKYIALAIPERGYIPSFYKADGTITMKWKLADTLVVGESTALSTINFKLVAGKDTGFAKITGKIKGNLSNSGKANGAVVYAYDLAGNVSGVALVNEKGSFSMTGLLPGSYTVEVDKFGYTSSSVQATAVDYNTAFNTSANLDLIEQSVTAVESNNVIIAKNYQLYQNYPNPFNPTTNIKFELPQSGNIKIVVYNVIGKEIATLVNDYRTAGVYNVTFDASKLSSGVYFYKILTNGFTATKKMVLMK